MAEFKLPATLTVAEVYPALDPQHPDICMFRCNVIAKQGFLVQSTPIYRQGYCSEGLKPGVEIDTTGMSLRVKDASDGKSRLWLGRERCFRVTALCRYWILTWDDRQSINRLEGIYQCITSLFAFYSITKLH